MFYKTWIIFSIAFVLLINTHFFINAPAPIPSTTIKDPLEAFSSNFPYYRVDLSTPATRIAMVVGNN
jgi:hypothetical protein